MSSDERLDQLERKIDALSAESDRRRQELIGALDRSQEQTNRRIDAVDRLLSGLGRRLEGLDLRADVIEENLSRIMRHFKIRQHAPQ